MKRNNRSVLPNRLWTFEQMQMRRRCTANFWHSATKLSHSGRRAFVAAQHDVFHQPEVKVLIAGEELKKEILPLNMGHIMYEIIGLKESTWYEVKISYPASIPSSFSISVLSGDSTKAVNLGRKLLNIEKRVFNSNKFSVENPGNKVFASVTVKPAGFVGKHNLKEQDFVIFNILCEELLYGLPRQAWWVGLLVLLCVIFSFFVPLLFQSHLIADEHVKRLE